MKIKIAKTLFLITSISLTSILIQCNWCCNCTPEAVLGTYKIKAELSSIPASFNQVNCPALGFGINPTVSWADLHLNNSWTIEVNIRTETSVKYWSRRMQVCNMHSQFHILDDNNAVIGSYNFNSPNSYDELAIEAPTNRKFVIFCKIKTCGQCNTFSQQEVSCEWATSEKTFDPANLNSGSVLDLGLMEDGLMYTQPPSCPCY